MSQALLWKFEAFREYIVYEVLQPALSVLNLFEGEFISESNPKIKKLERLLEERTRKSTWKPNRSGTEDLLWNPEGDFTRNKERLFTSLLLMYPKEMSNGKLKLTEFGKALGTGKISRQQFYDFIIFNFKYPHPAYEDNWKEWVASGKELYPLIFILQVLIELLEKDESQCFLNVREIEFILVPSQDHKQCKSLSDAIIKSRNSDSISKLKPSGDKLTRKITDLLGFLCISGYTYYLPNGDISLNLISKHSVEKTHYYFERKPAKKDKESALHNIKSLILKRVEEINAKSNG
ncbi:hypothetical protein [Colwellia sp. RSH04]|uniref:hypothetical protein n=1 Tax=Colwellia sp. RSH04 TaxID=2305464 RepID=UPI000E585DB8|nr:hypothetical protein [Colwellia sp. RSH04]RHW77575.1 hypothetical protein D1094_01080 [Colwellia sp. RSH04]